MNNIKGQSLDVQRFDEDLHAVDAGSATMHVIFVRHGENVCDTYGARIVFLSLTQVCLEIKYLSCTCAQTGRED